MNFDISFIITCFIKVPLAFYTSHVISFIWLAIASTFTNPGTSTTKSYVTHPQFPIYIPMLYGSSGWQYVCTSCWTICNQVLHNSSPASCQFLSAVTGTPSPADLGNYTTDRADPAILRVGLATMNPMVSQWNKQVLL